MALSKSPIACPTCGVSIPSPQLEVHLLQTHRTYSFRGEVRPVPETLALLLAAVVSSQPDLEAWHALETIAAHECGSGVGAFLASSLTESLKRLPPETRQFALSAVANLIAQECTCTRQVLEQLATSTDASARHLARSVANRVPGLLMREVLESLLSDSAPKQAIEWLRWLAKGKESNPAVLEVLAERERGVCLRCSRCNGQFARAEMIQHLWSAHGLVLDKRRPRDPWDVIDDWIAHYRRRHDEKLLQRCYELGQRWNPKLGLLRVYRRFLAGGLKHSDARAYLLNEASEHHASLCPHCYAVVPMPEQAAPAAVSLSHGRLSACGYRVEIRDSGVIPFVEIESPERSARRLPLPGPRLTPQGAILFFVGPLVLAAFLMAVLPLRLGIFALIQVLTFLLPAIGFSIWIRIAGKQAAPASERAVGRAWAKLAPTLHERDYSLSDSSFLAGLALESIGRGDAQRRSRVLESVLAVTEKAAATQPGTLHHLAALRVLAIADAVESVGDPVTLTAVQVGRCFAGRLALPFADGLLASWRREWRTKANLARLRVLLLDRAFEAGFEVRDLLSAGQTAPQLGRILGTDDPGGLARLRLLWSLRPRRPWDRCGHAETAFSLAGATAGGQVLGKYADLLLYRAGTSHGNRNEAAQKLEIVVSGRGVIVSGKLFSEPVATLEVKRTEFGHELLVGGERFAVDGDPDQAATEVERWLRYYFHEFVPMVAEVYHWRSPHAASILRAWGTIGCPECQARFVARPGEIGITAGEEKAPGDSDERPVLAGK